MEVLILSKTRFQLDSVCVGGMILSDCRFVRLLNQGRTYQPIDTKLNIGDVWDISFYPVMFCRPPHTEDVIVQSRRFIRHVDRISPIIEQSHVPIWEGAPYHLFDNKLLWANTGVGYLSVDYPNLPSHSVGFWISNKDLTFEDTYYCYPGKYMCPRRKFKYKGLVKPVSVIPAGTMIHVSLARWWKPEVSELEERCYTQLSGWYDYEEPSEGAEICSIPERMNLH
jgi:hypothetical protein